jgi:hypothetical protein
VFLDFRGKLLHDRCGSSASSPIYLVFHNKNALRDPWDVPPQTFAFPLAWEATPITGKIIWMTLHTAFKTRKALAFAGSYFGSSPQSPLSKAPISPPLFQRNDPAKALFCNLSALVL